MSLEFNRGTKIATVPITDGTSITVQSVYDQFKDYEDEPANMDLKRMISAGGKTFLSVGRFTVVTITLLDGWLLAFAERGGPATIQTTVEDGNIVAQDEAGDPVFPIAPTAFTAVTIAQATTGAIIESGAQTPQELWDYVPASHVPGSAGEFLFKKLAKFAEMLGLIRR
jgi:hypothetical protein